MVIDKKNLKSLTFIVLISAYFAFVLNVKFWTFVFTNVEVNSVFETIALCVLPLILFVAYFIFFCLTAIPYVGKLLTAILLICSAASDYALQNLGIVINSDMIRNFAETTSREAADFITIHFMSYVLILGVLPAIGLCWININFSTLKTEIKNRLLGIIGGLFIVGVIVPFFYKPYISFGRNNYQIRYYINTFNYINSIMRYCKKNANKNRKFVILDDKPEVIANNQEQPRVLVLILGETARAKNFSLYGYERNTNPLLEKQDIIVFKRTKSCGTSTAVSLPCMFSVTGKHKFNITDAQYTQNLLDIVQKAGDDIIWKDNDDGCKRVCLRVKYIDARDGNKQPHCFNDYCYDEILLDELDTTLDNVKKDTLIVLHAMGSHGPSYYKRYPDSMKKFLPTCDTEDLQECSQDKIINTYDNTILYTDYVISSVIDMLKTRENLQASMLYVSDHGESLGEHNVYLHGLPEKIAPKEQKEVPMILWLSDKTKDNMNIDTSCLVKKAANGSFSHDNYAHTVFGLLAIKTTVYKENLDVLNQCQHK